MLRQRTIQHFLAGFLLGLSALSVTPKRFLHDLFADHKDQAGKFAHDPYTHVQRSFYSCHIDDLVVDLPFIQGPVARVPQAPLTFCSRYADRDVRPPAITSLFLPLRGPPSIA